MFANIAFNRRRCPPSHRSNRRCSGLRSALPYLKYVGAGRKIAATTGWPPVKSACLFLFSPGSWSNRSVPRHFSRFGASLTCPRRRLASSGGYVFGHCLLILRSLPRFSPRFLSFGFGTNCGGPVGAARTAAIHEPGWMVAAAAPSVGEHGRTQSRHPHARDEQGESRDVSANGPARAGPRFPPPMRLPNVGNRRSRCGGRLTPENPVGVA